MVHICIGLAWVFEAFPILEKKNMSMKFTWLTELDTTLYKGILSTSQLLDYSEESSFLMNNPMMFSFSWPLEEEKN